ncbi:O-antigen ligase family protein [Candidatus Denitrolinea symbiosum]|nr:O-antigen ligase family protein [Candidatus Denitrolinea symbiosum]
MQSVELLFFGYLFYSLLAVPFDIYVPYLAVLWLFVLTLISLFVGDFGKNGKTMLLLVGFTTGLHLLIQLFVFKTSLADPYNEPFWSWLILIIPVFVLTKRPGFFKHLAFAMFLIAVILRFDLINKPSEAYVREALYSGSGIDNANDYAAWLGFCALIFWALGWKKHGLRRLLFWGMAVGGLMLLMLTVSRGALFALVVAGMCGIRFIPKHYRVRAVIGLGIIYLIFNMIPLTKTGLQYYQLRLTEDTGRLTIWRASVQLIQLRPWLGYGTNVLGGSRNIARYGQIGILPISSPHNPFLLLWLGSGIFPVIPFSVLWLIALRNSFRYGLNVLSDLDPFPLVVFGFITVFVANTTFAYVWGCAVIAYSYSFLESPMITIEKSVPKYSKPNSFENYSGRYKNM